MSDTGTKTCTASAPSHPLMLSPQECQVILKIRGLEFGRVDVQVQNGRPVLIEKHEKTKL